MADVIESITVGGVERLGRPVFWTGNDQSFAEELHQSIVRNGFNLDTAWWSTVQEYKFSEQQTPAAIEPQFSPDGKRLYVIDAKFFSTQSRIDQYDVARPWDLNSAVTLAGSFTYPDTTHESVRTFEWTPDGNNLTVVVYSIFNSGAERLYRYRTDTPWELSAIRSSSAAGISSSAGQGNLLGLEGQESLDLQAIQQIFYRFGTGSTRFLVHVQQGATSERFVEYETSEPYLIEYAQYVRQSQDIKLGSSIVDQESPWQQFRFLPGGRVLYGIAGFGSTVDYFPFWVFNLEDSYNPLAILPTTQSSTGDFEIVTDKLGLNVSGDANDFALANFQFMPNGCGVMLYDSVNDTVYKPDLACGTFVPPSSDQAAGDVPGIPADSTAPFIDPNSFTPALDGPCIVIESTALGACSSEELIIVKQGGVEYVISSKFLGNDSFCGELEAHLLDSYGVQNSTATNFVQGADHLAGEVVAAWGDGEDLGFYKVSSTGTFTIPVEATSITYGLPYTAWFKSVKLAYGAEFGSALTQRKKVNHLGFILYCAHARGLYYGPSTDKLNPMPRIEAGKVISPDAIWPHYDEETIEFPGEWDTDSRIVLRARAPRGVTVLASIIQMDTREKI